MFDELGEDTELDFGGDMPHEEKAKLWETIYSKVQQAVVNNHNFAILFNVFDPSEGVDGDSSVIIEKSQFELFLRNYLMWCEENEMFERCAEVKKIIHKLQGII